MKHESTKNGSPRKSKMMWLLFAALILASLTWFGRQYYEDHKEGRVARTTTESNLGREHLENHKQVVTVQLSKKVPHTGSLSPSINVYQKLSDLLIKHPNANQFIVNWDEDNDDLFLNGSLEYNRKEKTFVKIFSGPFSSSTHTSWKDVTDKALHDAAEAEKAIDAAVTNHQPVPKYGPIDMLRKSGARMRSY